jgi:hypothetical protein
MSVGPSVVRWYPVSLCSRKQAWCHRSRLENEKQALKSEEKDMERIAVVHKLVCDMLRSVCDRHGECFTDIERQVKVSIVLVQ